MAKLKYNAAKENEMKLKECREPKILLETSCKSDEL